MQSQRQLLDRDRIHSSRVVIDTKKGYDSSMSAVKNWIRQFKSADYLYENGEVNLNVFTEVDFEDFLVWKYNTGKIKAKSLSAYRSAIKNYYL